MHVTIILPTTIAAARREHATLARDRTSTNGERNLISTPMTTSKTEPVPDGWSGADNTSLCCGNNITTTTAAATIDHQPESSSSLELPSPSESTLALHLSIRTSRMVSSIFEPALFGSRRHVARRMVVTILRCITTLLHSNTILTSQRRQWRFQLCVPAFVDRQDGDNMLQGICRNAAIQRRHLKLPGLCCIDDISNDSRNKRRRRRSKISMIVLYIHPPNTERPPLSTAWEGRVIAWENRLVQAMSLAGYCSTLGGGFFMCHHFSTAIAVAVRQVHMAVLLDDRCMFFKCIINMAYNYIHAGQWDMARKWIHYVLRQLSMQQQQHHPDDPVLYSMCQSALFILKRMRKCAKQQLLLATTAATLSTRRHYIPDIAGHDRKRNHSSNNTTRAQGVGGLPSKTVDNLARIRIAQDQSNAKDFRLLQFRHL